MNCDDFLTRMHECIDDRVPFDSDPQLRIHAKDCPSCRMQWMAWLHISSVVSAAADDTSGAVRPENTRRNTANRIHARGMSGLAVAALVLMTFVANHQGETKSGRTKTGPAALAVGIDHAVVNHIQPFAGTVGPLRAGESVDSRVNAAQWWREVQDRDWLAQTMPTVRSLRDGVVPLGRSIMQAVSILTVGGGERTS